LYYIGIALLEKSYRVFLKKGPHFGFWNFSAFKAAVIKVEYILAMPCPCSF
jgi:hypothetical protein